MLHHVNKSFTNTFACTHTSANGFNTMEADNIGNRSLEVRDEIQEVSGSDADWMLTSTIIIFTMQTGRILFHLI